jgi:hypothetical protein
MNYSKPEVTVSGPAVREIQGMTKPPEIDLDLNNSGDYSTVSAYAADE